MNLRFLLLSFIAARHRTSDDLNLSLCALLCSSSAALVLRHRGGHGSLHQVPDGLGHSVRGVSRQGVVKVPDEVVSVLLGQGHEGAPHHDELHFVHAVAQLLQLQITRKDFIQLLHLSNTESFHRTHQEVQLSALTILIIMIDFAISKTELELNFKKPTHKPDPPPLPPPPGKTVAQKKKKKLSAHFHINCSNDSALLHYTNGPIN